MQCPNCGAEAPNDALLCPECGTKLESIWQAPRISDTPVAANFVKPRTLYIVGIVGLVLLGILLVLNYAALFAIAFTGQEKGVPGGWLFGLILTTGLFFYFWWKLRGRNGWHGALIGLACSFLAGTVAAFIRGFMIAG